MMRRSLTLASCGIGLLAIVAVTWSARDAREVVVKPGQMTVTLEPLVSKIEADGELLAKEKATLGANTPGVWEYSIVMMAPEGQPVQAGQPVLGFDAKTHRDQLEVRQSELETERKALEKIVLEGQQQVEEMELQRAEGRARADKARRKAEVPPELEQANELAKAKLDLRLAELENELNDRRVETATANLAAKKGAGEAKVARLKNVIAELQARIDRMTCKAPRAGFVVYLDNWREEKPKIGDQAWYGQAIIEIADLSQMMVQAQVPEIDAGRVRVGQKAEVRLDANPDKLFLGQVVELGRMFHTKSPETPSIVFDATIALDKPEPNWMRPGMAADVVILAESEKPVISVPEDALLFDETGARVERLGSNAGTVAVKLGMRADGRVEIVDGLQAGDVIRVSGAGL